MSVNLAIGYERITKHMNRSNSTRYLEMFKGAVFIITGGNILHPFIARAILEAYDPEN